MKKKTVKKKVTKKRTQRRAKKRAKPLGGVFTALKTIEGYARAGGDWVNRHEKKILLSVETMLIMISAFNAWRFNVEKARLKQDKSLVKLVKTQRKVTDKLYQNQARFTDMAELQAKGTQFLASEQQKIKELQTMGMATNEAMAAQVLGIKKQISKLKNKTDYVNKVLNSPEFKEFAKRRFKLKDIKKK